MRRGTMTVMMMLLCVTQVTSAPNTPCLNFCLHPHICESHDVFIITKRIHLLIYAYEMYVSLSIDLSIWHCPSISLLSLTFALFLSLCLCVCCLSLSVCLPLCLSLSLSLSLFVSLSMYI